MSAYSYQTIQERVEAVLKERGSKFIAHAYPVSSEADIKNKLEVLHTTYPDATHICYAWHLANPQERSRANDDGEPKNSAGQPILRAIKSLEVTHVLVAVVRYYGGKKLGVSGLVDAYGGSARLALESATVVTKTRQKTFYLKHNLAKDYLIYEYAARLSFEILAPPDHPGGYFTIELPESEVQHLTSALESLPNFELNETIN